MKKILLLIVTLLLLGCTYSEEQIRNASALIKTEDSFKKTSTLSTVNLQLRWDHNDIGDRSIDKSVEISFTKDQDAHFSAILYTTYMTKKFGNDVNEIIFNIDGEIIPLKSEYNSTDVNYVSLKDAKTSYKTSTLFNVSRSFIEKFHAAESIDFKIYGKNFDMESEGPSTKFTSKSKEKLGEYYSIIHDESLSKLLAAD